MKDTQKELLVTFLNNKEKILKAAHELRKSPSQLVNDIIESVNLIIKVEIEKVDMNFNKVKIETKESGKPQKKKSMGRILLRSGERCLKFKGIYK